MWTLYHKIWHKQKKFKKYFFGGPGGVKIEKSCDFRQQNRKNVIFAQKMPKKWEKHIFSATNTFLIQNSLVYAQKSSLKWPILTNLLFLGVFLWKNGHFLLKFWKKNLNEKSILSVNFRPIGLKFGRKHLCMVL